MAKSKKVKKNSAVKVSETRYVDEEILSQAIVKAYFEIDKKKKDEEQRLSEEEQKEWLSFLGQKEYPNNEKWYKKKWYSMKNDFVCLFKLLFINPKRIRDMRATFALMSITVVGIFALLKWFLYGLCAALISLMVKKEIAIFAGATWVFILWMVARIFRIAIYEIREIKDGNLLIAIFSGVLSFVAVIIAIVAIIIDKA